MPDNSLINLGDISKPATVLVEKISDAIGGLFKPYQIVRVAQAESEAERIRAEGQIEISDLQRRAFHRFLQEEAKQQNNMEQVTRDALPQLNDQAKPDKIEDDWITNFFAHSRLISDQEMQRLWSRVLAGEANAPGTFSKRTVNFLSDLDKNEAAAFTQLCGFAWQMSSTLLTPLIFVPNDDIYIKHGIHFGSILHLESIGLVQFNTVASFQMTDLPKHLAVSYFGEPVRLELPKDSGNTLDIGKVMLTQVGNELCAISGRQPVEGFLQFIQAKWTTLQYIKEPITSDTTPTTSVVPPPGS